MTHKKTFIKSFFKNLEDSEYALLKHIDYSIDEIGDHSDLDLLMTETTYHHILKQVKQAPHLLKCKVAPKSTMSQVFLYFEDDTFLQIDFLFGFFRKDIVYLDRERILDYAAANSENIKVCSLHHLIEHLMLFNFLNYAGVPDKYLNYFAQQAPHLQHRLMSYLNKKYDIKLQDWNTLSLYKAEMRVKMVEYLQRQPFNKREKNWSNRWRYFREVLGNIRLKRGMIITFTGVDGAGKSTILEEVKDVLKKKYRRNVIVLRHRPSLLPILSAYRHGKEAAEQKSAATLPRQGKNNSKLGSLLRFAYYYTDYLLGQFYIKVRYLWRGYIVLFDRYYFDFIIDGKRSNINLSKRIPRLGYPFIQKAPLNLFLYASPEVIRSRKQELPVESIQQLTEEYIELFDDLREDGKNESRYVVIENIDKAETLGRIIEEYKALV